MSALDKIRSFAEARCDDHEVVRDGITYGDCRELMELRKNTLEEAAKLCERAEKEVLK